ncbi:MAG: heavy metal sensor histidine kinase [Armatimonadetes bacterium]|nr:heavy metal sensor histidine kinase [Armatimonadota bacterium]
MALSPSTPLTRLPFLRSLRAQLALWYGAILALTLLLLSVFTLLLLRQYLTSRADDTLKLHATDTSRTIAAILYRYNTENPGRPPSPDIEKAFIDNNDLQSWGRYVQVINPYGNPVVRSDALKTIPLPRLDEALQDGLKGKTRFDTESKLGEYPVRIVSVPVVMGQNVPYIVQVGASVEGVDTALTRAANLLLILTPSVFLIALLGGGILVGRALKPVDDMTQAALTIESKRLDVRIVPPRSDNEISRLASALNEMIARLDKSFRQIERFSADASHELKTPLTAMRGEAEVALMGEKTPHEYQETLRSVIEETERLSSIVTNLLLLARADANQVKLRQEEVSLDEIAMEAFEGVESLARRKHISLDIAEMDETPLLGDSLWLQQLAANLLQNAVNYTPEGGSVVLSVRREAVEGEVFAVLSVEDTGHGIPEEHLPHIFDRFYRVDSGRSREQGGSGLGLNIVRWIAESHGGTIAVTSAVGQGSTFEVRLPALS